MKGCELRKPEKTEGIAVQGLPFKRTRHEGACKAFANPCSLRQVEIAAATFGDGHQFPQFFPVFLPELFLGQTTSVVDSPQNDQCAYLETLREARYFSIQISALTIFILEFF